MLYIGGLITAALLSVAILVPDTDTGTPVDVDKVIEQQSVIDAIIVVDEQEPEVKKHLYGVCTITHYDNGPCCCGQWAYGNTASGVPPTVNHTVASTCLPFGTQIEINGQRYVVEDRGDANMDDFWIDIYVASHDEANQRGMYQAEVYIIDEE